MSFLPGYHPAFDHLPYMEDGNRIYYAGGGNNVKVACGQTVVSPLSNSQTLELPLCVLSAAELASSGSQTRTTLTYFPKT